MSLEGIQLGRYQLYQMLGSGGMGEVYLAEDSGLGRQVAIKVVRSQPYYNFDLESAVRTERLFEREMKVISQLDHPHILPLYDYGETRANGATITYMVMPYRPEGSFSAWLQQRRSYGPLSMQDATNLIGQAAGALQHAHEHQVIHQDIKPANFLIRRRSEDPEHPDLQLMDFGISRISTATANSSQFVEGTPAYMAPEQWKGHPTYASDQYALAVMAYELLAGRQPFSGRAESIMYKHISEMPPEPSSINPTLSPAIDEVLLRALAKQPEERFASVAAFASALQQACASEQSTIIRTHASASEGHGSAAILADERLEAEQSSVITRRKTSTGEAEYGAGQAATPMPISMAPTPVFYAPPPVIGPGEAGQPMAKMADTAEARGLSSGSTPYEAGMFGISAAPPMPQRSFSMNKTLRIGLIITLIWAVGGLFVYFAFAHTAPKTASNATVSASHNTTMTPTQAGNTQPSMQSNSAGTHQTTTNTTTTTQVQTGTNSNVSANTSAQSPANAPPGNNANTQAQQNANAQAAAYANATATALANARATATVVAMAAPLYRLYSATAGDHFYTMSAAERNNAVAADGYIYEGIAAYVFSTQAAGSVPLYRLYSAGQGDHFYTTSAAERDRAVAADGYRYEGIAAYVFSTQVAGSVPLYRLYSAKAGDHFYTRSAAEAKTAAAADGYTYEGVACYVLTS